MEVVGLLISSLQQGGDETTADGGIPSLKEGEKRNPSTRCQNQLASGPEIVNWSCLIFVPCEEGPMLLPKLKYKK
jgi:hypothetical protein